MAQYLKNAAKTEQDFHAAQAIPAVMEKIDNSLHTIENKLVGRIVASGCNGVAEIISLDTLADPNESTLAGLCTEDPHSLPLY